MMFVVYRKPVRQYLGNKAYNGFCLGTAGIYFSKIAGEEWKGRGFVRLDLDKELQIIKITPTTEGTLQVKSSKTQTYVSTILLKQVMPKGRYIFTEESENGKCYKLQN